MSPFCPGRTLAECPSSQASDLRFWIIDQARGGATREEVEAELFSIYGDQLLQSPRPEGIGLVAYVVPVLFLLGGAALVVLFLARQRRAAVPEPPPAPALVDPELERRLDEDLARGHEA